MFEPSIIAAFIAGLITFLAPCTLPLLPAYLGVALGGAAGPINRRALLAKTLTFVGGFGLVFLGFGAIAGLFGASLIKYQGILSKVGGVVVIIFALSLLGMFRLPLFERARRIPLPSWAGTDTKSGLFLLGAAFGFGWSPCLGPILGSILILAASSGTALHGMFLLFVYTLGLSIPFLIFALGLGEAMLFSAKFQNFLKLVSLIGGLFLLLLGLFLFFGRWEIITGFVAAMFEVFHYERLMDYM